MVHSIKIITFFALVLLAIATADAATVLSNAGKIQGHIVPAPTSGDNGKALTYNSTTSAFQYSTAGGGTVYPAAGVANSTGSAWGTSYGADNPFPATFIPVSLSNRALTDVELDKVSFPIQSITQSTTSIDPASGSKYLVSLSGNWSPTFTTPPTSGLWSITLIIKQDATGGRTVTWPAGILWGDNGVPVLSTGANKIDVIHLNYSSVIGTSWLGSVANTGY